MSGRGKAKACTHTDTFHARGHKVTYAKGVKRRPPGFGLRDQAIVDVRICRGGVDNEECGAWLSLGESNDAPAEVQCELRAAELAAGEPSTNVEYMGRIGQTVFVNDVDILADDPDWLAGYLAACIASHSSGDCEGGNG